MSKVNASIVYMLGSFIFLLSVIIPQFANAQEEIPKINEKQKEALELFSNSQSLIQQTSAVDIQQNNINSDKNILKKIIQQELQEKQNEQEKQEQASGDNQQEINPIKAIENSKSLKEQSQEQVTNNDKEIKALELFFNKGTQQQEIQQQSNEGKQQQEVKASTATTKNSKPVKGQGQEIQQQQQVKQGIKQKADSNLKQAEPFMLFFNAQLKEKQQQYLKQQQLEQEKQKLQEILNEQEKQQQQPIQQQQTINQQQIEQEIQQKLEQEKQKLQEKLNEQKKQ